MPELTKVYKGLEFKLKEMSFGRVNVIAKDIYQTILPGYNFVIEVRKNAYDKYDGDIFSGEFKHNHEIGFNAIDTFEQCVDLLLEDLVGYFNKKARKATEYADRLKEVIDKLK